MPARSVVRHLSPSAIPQSRPVPGREAEMAKNDAGGYVFQADDWTRLDRFLILGSEGGTYYASEAKVTVANAKVVSRCVKQDALRTALRIGEISDSGRAPRNDAAIIALVLAARDANTDADRGMIYAQLPKVCRTATHLFMFVDTARELGVWGRGTRRAIQRWYLDLNTDHRLALQLVKYRNREGWSHRDLLRLVRPKTTAPPVPYGRDGGMLVDPTPVRNHLLGYAVGKVQVGAEGWSAPRIVEGFEKALHAATPEESARLVAEYRLPRECVRPEHQNDKVVQEALLENIPMTALVRNLGNYSKSGLLVAMSDTARDVVAKLHDQEQITRSRIHPMSILLAMRQYQAGHGFRGHGEWRPVQAVVDALDDAFYASVGNVPTSGKRFLLGIDVSGSMQYSQVGGFNITPREAACAMALITAKAEPEHLFLGYATRAYELKISPKMRLEDAIRAVEAVANGEGTDCSVPMKWLVQNNLSVDAVVSYTDGETWAGQQHPYMSMKHYRAVINSTARFVNAAFVANPGRLSDPGDPLALECVGLDANLAEIIRSFTVGEF